MLEAVVCCCVVIYCQLVVMNRSNTERQEKVVVEHISVEMSSKLPWWRIVVFYAGRDFLSALLFKVVWEVTLCLGEKLPTFRKIRSCLISTPKQPNYSGTSIKCDCLFWHFQVNGMHVH